MKTPVTPTLVRAIRAELDAAANDRPAVRRRGPEGRLTPLRHHARAAAAEIALLAKRRWLWLTRREAEVGRDRTP